MELNKLNCVIHVSCELDENFRKMVFTHKSNRLRMRNNDHIVIDCFVYLDCILEKPERGHSSQFCKLFLMARLIFNQNNRQIKTFFFYINFTIKA